MFFSAPVPTAKHRSIMKNEVFGKLAKGEEVRLFTVSNKKIELSVMEYGAAVVSLKFKGKETVLGFDRLKDYLSCSGSYGAVIGRYAGRISGAVVRISGVDYPLTKNDGNNTRNGGALGFSKRLWHGEADENSITMQYLSADNEEGFPGEMLTTVRYKLLESGVVIEYFAKSDRDTVVNLTNQIYFNFSGGKHDVSDHTLFVDADYFSPVDLELLPTGEKRSVFSTPFDFRTPSLLKDKFTANDGQLRLVGGIDHNFLLNGRGIRKVACLASKSESISMECLTDMPYVKIYTSNKSELYKIHGGYETDVHYGVCIEPQFFGAGQSAATFSPNVLKKGDVFSSITELKFS